MIIPRKIGYVRLIPLCLAMVRYDQQNRRVPLSALIFHELAEADSKVDLGKQYWNYDLGDVRSGMVVVTPTGYQRGAHFDAVDREIRLRNQRPKLNVTGRAGDDLIHVPK